MNCTVKNTPPKSGTIKENDHMKTIKHKVPDGKLLRIKLEVQENEIKDISITGDFFMYPEEGIEYIEKALKGININEVEEKTREVIAERNIEITGFSPKDLQKAIKPDLN